MVSYLPARFGGQRRQFAKWPHNVSSCDFMDRSPLCWVTILPILAAIGIVAVQI